MRILYDHEIFVLQRYGGISRYFSEIIPRIAATAGNSVLAFQGIHVNAYSIRPASGAPVRVIGARMDGPLARRAARANRFVFKAFAALSRPQIYHLTTYRDHLPGRRVPKIITLHDLIWNRFPEMVNPGRSVTPHRELIHAADGVICVSEQTRADAIELLGIPRERTTVIHHANSLTVAPSPKRPLDRPYVLYVGHRGGYKNFSLVLRAFARKETLRRVLALACVGPALTPQERTEIEGLGLAGTVVHAPAQDDAALATMYAHARCFVYPSLWEGFGIPLLEAMHYGCPVVAANASCFPEVLGGAGLMFDPKSPDALADTLESACMDGTVRAGLIDAGRAREAGFSWEASARATIEFYAKVAGH